MPIIALILVRNVLILRWGRDLLFRYWPNNVPGIQLKFLQVLKVFFPETGNFYCFVDKRVITCQKFEIHLYFLIGLFSHKTFLYRLTPTPWISWTTLTVVTAVETQDRKPSPDWLPTILIPDWLPAAQHWCMTDILGPETIRENCWRQ